MNAVVIGNAEWKDILDALVATGAPWDGAIMHLFKNNFTPSAQSVLADFTEADFTGYGASAAITWAAAGFLPDGSAIVEGDAKTFAVGGSPTILNTVYGWYLTDTGGTTLLFARRFDTPVVLSGALQQITVLPAYPAYVTQ